MPKEEKISLPDEFAVYGDTRYCPPATSRDKYEVGVLLRYAFVVRRNCPSTLEIRLMNENTPLGWREIPKEYKPKLDDYKGPFLILFNYFQYEYENDSLVMPFTVNLEETPEFFQYLSECTKATHHEFALKEACEEVMYQPAIAPITEENEFVNYLLSRELATQDDSSFKLTRKGIAQIEEALIRDNNNLGMIFRALRTFLFQGLSGEIKIRVADGKITFPFYADLKLHPGDIIKVIALDKCQKNVILKIKK